MKLSEAIKIGSYKYDELRMFAPLLANVEGCADIFGMAFSGASGMGYSHCGFCIRELEQHFPQLRSEVIMPVQSDERTHAFTRNSKLYPHPLPVRAAIVLLYDKYKWDAQRIAAWLETQQL